MSALEPGVWGVLATPFTGPGLDVDTDSVARLARHYEEIGATGLTVLGVFGEAAKLASEERRAVLAAVCRATRLPLVVGMTGTATAPVIEEARLARDVVGPDRLAGAMVQVNSARPEVLAAHLRAVRAATGLDLVPQDYPLVTGVTITASALARAVRDTPGVVAVKAESPPTPAAIATLVEEAPGVPVFGGLGGIGLLDELAAGASGAMTGFSVPEGLLACVNAWRAGGYPAARAAYLPYLPLVNFEAQARIGLAIRKEALRRLGLIAGSGVRPPAPAMPGTLGEQLDAHLAATPKGT